jgi:hypothetical protein
MIFSMTGSSGVVMRLPRHRQRREQVLLAAPAILSFGICFRIKIPDMSMPDDRGPLKPSRAPLPSNFGAHDLQGGICSGNAVNDRDV